MTRLIILDRDGVINFDSPDYIKSADEWRPIPGALDAIAALKERGWKVAVCSNQSGIGRGLISLEALDAIHEKMCAALNTTLDGIDFCPHRPDEHCPCRKPRPGMLIDMMARLAVLPEQSVVIGDSLRDMEAGRSAGCRCVLVRTGNGRVSEAAVRTFGVYEVFDDLRTAAQSLLAESEGET